MLTGWIIATCVLAALAAGALAWGVTWRREYRDEREWAGQRVADADARWSRAEAGTAAAKEALAREAAAHRAEVKATQALIVQLRALLAARKDEHDDEHRAGELARAAACYAIPEDGRDVVPMLDCEGREYRLPARWPRKWAGRWYKPVHGDRRRELVKAAALIVAEIRRLARAAAVKLSPLEAALQRPDVREMLIQDAVLTSLYGPKFLWPPRRDDPAKQSDAQQHDIGAASTPGEEQKP